MTQNEEFKGLAKVPTAISGFDEITSGGLPKDRTTLIVGGPGSGKTVFAIQSLVNGARDFGESGIDTERELLSLQRLRGADELEEKK